MPGLIAELQNSQAIFAEPRLDEEVGWRAGSGAGRLNGNVVETHHVVLL